MVGCHDPEWMGNHYGLRASTLVVFGLQLRVLVLADKCHLVNPLLSNPKVSLLRQDTVRCDSSSDLSALLPTYTPDSMACSRRQGSEDLDFSTKLFALCSQVAYGAASFSLFHVLRQPLDPLNGKQCFHPTTSTAHPFREPLTVRRSACAPLA